MFKTLLVFAGIIGFAYAPAQNAPSLASLKDSKRVLLVFAPSDQNSDFQQQFQMLSRSAADMQQRDLVIVPVLVNVGQYTSANTLRNTHPPVASDQDQVALRNRFHVAPGEFSAILIGKDGGEKLREHTPISAEKLNQTIDAMPMRKDEMRQQKPQ